MAEASTKLYDGPYQDKDHITSEDVDHIIQGKGAIYSEVVQNLATPNQTVGALVKDVRWLFRIMAGSVAWVTLLLTGIGILVAVVGLGKH